MKKYIMKDSVFQTIRENPKLKSEIADSQKLQLNSVRMTAINKSTKLTEYNTVQIIKKHTGLKDSEIFDYKETE